ncbi:MAG TPA: hypothetical protein VHD58_02175 [Mycobacteriales bacterium]|nr:hypothetical protein [Mycobacteriales bacterium]
MATTEEIEGARRDRELYLIAIYDLTKDEHLRWSTHRDVAQTAGIAEDRILMVSQRLSEEGLVVIRTMGGIDGYVELTALGAQRAEALILAAGGENAAEMGGTTVPADFERWVAQYEPMVSLGFQSFVRDGDWPDVDAVQRALDRAGHDITVRTALQEMPREEGEPRVAFPTNFYLPLRALRYLPAAERVLSACVDLVQRAVQIYLSDAGDLRVTSEDPSLSLSTSPEALRPAVRLLMRDFPSPFAGGGYGADGAWSLAINGASARQFGDIRSIDEYLERQSVLRREASEQLAAFAGRSTRSPIDSAPAGELTSPVGERLEAVAPNIFVVMPFGKSWSTGVYDFIRRAVRSLGISDSQVVRADKITDPGKIDVQILQAIQTADLVVGDITDVNPNVMWELGYAEALEVPSVILNQRVEDSPFDLANTRQVIYRLAPTDEDEANLSAHIQSALTEGASRRAV